jgi:hypothetical protein
MYPEGRNHFYLVLFSNGSQTLYPENSVAAFTAELARPVTLPPNERWEVGLCEFTCPPVQEDIFRNVDESIALIYCDLITPQLLAGTLTRAFRTYSYSTKHSRYEFHNIYYLPVEKMSFSNVRIEILQLSGGRVPFKDSKTPSQVVLHFRRYRDSSS